MKLDDAAEYRFSVVLIRAKRSGPDERPRPRRWHFGRGPDALSRAWHCAQALAELHGCKFSTHVVPLEGGMGVEVRVDARNWYAAYRAATRGGQATEAATKGVES